MKLKPVKVGAHLYHVVFRDKLVANSDNEQSLGTCNYMASEIEIATKTSNGRPIASSQQAEVVIHEIIHAIDHDRRADLSEEQVARMANGLNQVLHDNTDLFGTHYRDKFSASKKPD